MKVSPRTRSIAKWAAVPTGLLASGALVLGYSNAAFTAQTTNASNDWTTGTVNLSTTTVKPLFSHTQVPANQASVDPALKPGQTLTTRSIDIQYTGDVAADVRLKANVGSDPDAIAQYLNVSITEGGTNIYSGTLSALATDLDGVGNWSPPSTSSKTYAVTVTLASNIPNTLQGKTVSNTTFTWDAATA